MLSPQARGVATGQHLVTVDFVIACPIVGYGCCWWWWSLLVICHRCDIAFTSHRVTTCGCGRFLLSVLNGTRLCCCGVTRLLCIRATFCHSKRNVTFMPIYWCLLGLAFYWAKQAAVRVITRLVALCLRCLSCAICPKHWWPQTR